MLKTWSEKRINNIILSSEKSTTANDILAYLLNKKTIQSAINQKKMKYLVSLEEEYIWVK